MSNNWQDLKILHSLDSESDPNISSGATYGESSDGSWFSHESPHLQASVNFNLDLKHEQIFVEQPFLQLHLDCLTSSFGQISTNP